MTKQAPSLPHLEESLTEMTQLIEQMEQGELTLEQSLAHFERGITLVKHCQKILTDAEQKVQILVQHNNQETLSPYNDENKQTSAPESKTDK
jgi:exodeoxyribonuclease VII small subunit